MRNTFALFGYRLGVVIVLQIALIFLLIGRLFFLQIIDQEKYAGLSDRNRIRVTLKPSLRGNIKDRNGVVLAQSAPYYNARITCKDQECREKCKQVLVQKSFQFLPGVFDRKDNKSFVLKERLSWEDITLLEANKNDLPMVDIQTLYERTYPMDSVTPHFLGYTSRIPEDHPYAKKLPFSTVGRSGLEKLLDETLFGMPMLLEEEVNAYGEAMRTLSFNPGRKGDEVILTIDAELQDLIYRKLEPHKSGAAVVLDVNTGEVIALASYPSFNPGIFERGLSQAQWDALRHDIQTPLMDKAIMGQYALGSIIKPVIALAALEEGYITPETRYTCTGVTVIDGQPCHCWKDGGHGAVNLEEALRGSCNIYMYEIAKMMPLELLTKWLRRFGLGELTGSMIPGEKKGLLPSNEWKLQNRKERWRRIDTVYLTIGQGYVLATPLQLAKMMAQLVNGGHTITPHIIANSTVQSSTEIKVSKHHLAIITHAIGQVMNHLEGTGYRSRPQGVNWEMGGKSGTAQVRKITRRERAEGRHHGYDWEWKDKDHALFAGFAPLNKPKYVVIVLVEHGGFGGVTAAPIGRDIMQFVMQKVLQ
ncbi:MAG: penicillin-binding protein 2 [Alphaproteobacteria bacterium]|nr:penicillin-binding protein 2 [Alphaproteobacteria bacterium]